MSEWKKARKKPVVIEFRPAVAGETIVTLEGTLTAKEGDYIIKGVEGETYPIDSDIFDKTYEVLDEAQD